MINFEKDSEKKYRELLDMYYKDREEYEKELETAQNRRMEDHERKRSKNRREVWHFR